jgi:hypothetical protein
MPLCTSLRFFEIPENSLVNRKIRRDSPENVIAIRLFFSGEPNKSEEFFSLVGPQGWAAGLDWQTRVLRVRLLSKLRAANEKN